jgi:hypothetical protein
MEDDIIIQMRRTYLIIFLVSCSVLIFEVSLTRIFSIHLWYHFAFIVISIAMLGIGCAGTLLAVYLSGKDDFEMGWICSISSIARYAALTGISVLACYVISNYIPFDPVKFSWDSKQFLYLAFYCFTLSIPFFFSGILIAAVFSMYSEKSMSIYSFDLLGAGTGSLAVLVILNSAGPEYAVFSASALCLVGSIIAGTRKIKFLSILFLSLNCMVLLIYPDLMQVKISPYKNLSQSLKYPGAEHLNTYYSAYARIDIFRSPAVRFAPGLSLKYLDPLPDQIGLSVDGESINVITEWRDKEKLKFLEFLPSSLVYELRENATVLVLDPKGGLQVLMARHYGSLDTHVAESNPMIPKIIKDDFSDFSGGLYDLNSYTGYGRRYLRGMMSMENGSGLFDVIDIPMTGSSVSGFFGIAEDYRFTVEAFKEYLGALKTDGIMNISLYLIPPPRTEFRILSSVILAFEELGINGVSNRISALRSWDSMAILIKKSPFTNREISHMKAFAGEKRFDLVYYPGISEGESNKYIKLPSDEYFTGFTQILNKETKMSFLNNYLFDIKPVYDNNPFFHYYLKLYNIKPIYNLMGRKWLFFIEEGYLLPLFFVIILFLSLIMILVPVIIKSVKNKSLESFKRSSSLSVLIYFSMLGLGFMFVEVSLIQRSILVLENPSYSVAVILTAILMSSGAGSMMSSYFSKLRTSYCLIILSIIIMAYSLIQPFLFNMMIAYSLKMRIILITVSLIPLGFFMGIPFPMGITIIGRKHVSLIPWAWAINACLSVLAPALTVMIALVTGFRTVLWVGIIAYLLAFLSLRKLLKL